MAVPIHPDRLAVVGDRVHQLDLVGLVVGLVILDRAVALPDLGGDRITAVDDLFHLRLDQAEIFGGKRLFAVEVVIPAVLDHRADRDLHAGPDLLHRARHDMGGVVADQFERLRLVLHRVNRDLGVVFDRPLQIVVLAVHGGGNRLFGQRIGNSGGHFGGCHASLKRFGIAIGEGQGNLGHIGSLLVSLAPTERPVAGLVWPPCAPRFRRSQRKGSGLRRFEPFAPRRGAPRRANAPGPTRWR